jgi:hypothetical protein
VSRVVGIAIHRRLACLAALEHKGRQTVLSVGRRLDRTPNALSELLGLIPGEFRGAPVSIALSPADLACGDAWPLPPGMKSAALPRVGPSLCEARCAGEALEDLALDLQESRGILRAVALRSDRLAGLLEAAKGRRLQTITAIPAALEALFGEIDLQAGQERFQIRQGSWRSYPVDGSVDSGMLHVKDLDIPGDLAAAVAVALARPDGLPNLMNAVESRKSFVRRFAQPLLQVGAAGVLCLAALGVRYHREGEKSRLELESLRRMEQELWARTLPTTPPREGGLLGAMKKRLDEIGEAPGESSDHPSALAFWAEIARSMPDPEALGLTLETLDLAPDGGRMNARVPVGKEDPLRYAAELEGRLNKSEHLKSRGDYEVREGQVQVRLRMDFKP